MTTYLTSDEAASYSRLSVHTVRDAAERGDLSGIKTGSRGGGLWLFTHADIDRWLESKRRQLRSVRTARGGAA